MTNFVDKYAHQDPIGEWEKAAQLADMQFQSSGSIQRDLQTMLGWVLERESTRLSGEMWRLKEDIALGKKAAGILGREEQYLEEDNVEILLDSVKRGNAAPELYKEAENRQRALQNGRVR